MDLDHPESLRGERLSASSLWQLQRRYFEQQGVSCWSTGTVPHYITSNAYTAGAYARVLLGWMRDCVRTGDPLQSGEPMYIVELGSGSGRFAYQFLKRFVKLRQEAALGHVPFKYVMTDFVDSTIAFWRSHPRLQRYAEDGLLDFARFDAAQDQDLRLLHSGNVLKRGTVKNPVAVIANYFFDGLPQDAFAIVGGKLHEYRLTALSVPGDIELGSSDYFDRVALEFEAAPVANEPYHDAVWNTVLRTYEQRLQDTILLFPVAALACLDRVASLSRTGRTFLLSGDRGADREEGLLARQDVGLSGHGSFSLPVNYHCFGEIVKARGGEFLHAQQASSNLTVVGLLTGGSGDDHLETRFAFADAITQAGPDHFYHLKTALLKSVSSLSMEEMLACYRLSCLDPELFRQCAEELKARISSPSDDLRERILYVIRGVWDNYFPIGELNDLTDCLGDLLVTTGHYREAAEYFQASLEFQRWWLRVQPPSADNYYRAACCHFRRRELKWAAEFIQKSLDLDPDSGPARALRIQVETQLRIEDEQDDIGRKDEQSAPSILNSTVHHSVRPGRFQDDRRTASLN
jgi:hypothetical protein